MTAITAEVTGVNMASVSQTVTPDPNPITFSGLSPGNRRIIVEATASSGTILSHTVAVVVAFISLFFFLAPMNFLEYLSRRVSLKKRIRPFTSRGSLIQEKLPLWP